MSAQNEPREVWQPPIWLRRLDLVARDVAQGPWRHQQPAARVALAWELAAVALASLREQAGRRGCSVAELRQAHEQAAARLRARA